MQLQLWLNDPKAVYADGVALYNHFGTQKFLKDLFKNNTAYNRDRLQKELKSILNAMNAAPVLKKDVIQERNNSPVSKPVEKKQIKHNTVNIGSLPIDLQELEGKRMKLYKRAVTLHSHLVDLKIGDNGEAVFEIDKATRKKHALEIASNWQQINYIWKQLDYYAQHGVRLNDLSEKINSMSIYDLINRERTLRTYFTPKREATIAPDKLKCYKDESEQIKRRIKELTEDEL